MKHTLAALGAVGGGVAGAVQEVLTGNECLDLDG